MLGQSLAHPAMYGPLAALYAEMFATRTRYTGASLGYQIAATGAGFAPLAFAAILESGGSTVIISAVMAACCLVTAVSILVTRESHRADLSEEPATARTAS
nr:hypothetical protein GCM10020093_046760 [Planobispora longispora]